MKTVIYTYQNFKPIFFKLNRFYKIQNKKEYNNLIDKLLDIDAVTTPHIPDEEPVSYPLYLELQAGFTPNLKEVSKKYIKKEIKRAKKIL